MELVLRPYKLPNELVFLLKSNLTHDRDVFSFIYETLEDNQSLQYIFNHTFSYAEGEKNFKEMMKSLGWLHFRDRLSALYLNRIKDGKYPTQIDTSLINDMLILEQRLEDNTIQSVSRSYLFGFYLTALKLTDDYFSVRIPRVVFDLMKLGRTRVERIDWMLLLMWHFAVYLGDKNLHGAIVNERKTYKDLYQQLTDDQQKQMMTNLLHYAYSINDGDFFKHQMI